MEVQHERRVGEDRRAFTVFYRYGNERRNNTGNRRLDTVKELRPFFSSGMAQGCASASERAADIITEIAQAFGVPPDSLVLVANDDLVDSVEICQACDANAKRNEELEVKLAESRKIAEQYRSQVRDLLHSFNRHLQ